VILILFLVPEQHASFSDVFAKTINNSGMFGGSTSSFGFLFFCLPIAAILTQYTITGYDASAHLSEETKSAADGAAKGIWRSIFYSAIGGWILLLAFLFAATDVDAINSAGGFSGAIFQSALTPVFFKVVIIISTIGQFFCGMSCVTSMSRMTWAFSRDRAVPGHRLWSKVNRNRTPVNAIIGGCIAGALLTLPALYQNPALPGVPIAFYAVVSVTVIGLYLAFMIPIYLRLRMGKRFVPGPWSLGGWSRTFGWIAVIEILVISVYFIMPITPTGVPFTSGFTWLSVNYAPIAIGPVRTIDEPVPAERVGADG